MLSLLFGAALKGTLVLAAAGVLTLAMRRCSAASRHLVWTVALAALLVIPLLSYVLPRLNVPAAVEVAVTFRSNVVAPPASVVPPTGGPTRTEPVAPAQSPLSLSQILLLLWAAGTLVLLARIAVAYAAMARARHAARAYPENVRDLARSIGITRPVDVLEAEAQTMPLTFGILRPAVLMPAGSAQWDAERRRLVLLHEFAHVRRADPASHLLARLALAFFWWNPLAWSAWREFLKERERAADDLVLNSGARGSDYAQHLLDIARSFHSPALLDGAAIAVARRSQLEGRLLAILDSTRNRRAPRRAVAVAAAAAAFALLAPLAAVQAQDNGPLPDVDATIQAANQQKNHELVDHAAAQYKAAFKLDDAEKLLQTSVNIRASVSGLQSVDYGVGLIKLGQLENQRHNTRDAAIYFARAENILGDKPEVAPALTFLGVRAIANKQYDAAAKYFQRLGADDPSQQATALMWTAVVRDRQKNPVEAEELFKSALAVNPPGREGANIRSVYAGFLRKQSRFDEAKELQGQADGIVAAEPKPAVQASINGVSRVGNGVSAPRLVHKTEPQYSEEARIAGLQGTVTLYVEIGTDGATHNVRVLHSLGMGLDEEAIAAVSQWQFNPGLKNGAPVAVAASIEVNFRLL